MDPHYIADCLGGFLVEVEGEHPGYSIRVVSLKRGIRLRLEFNREVDEVQLHVEQYHRHHPRLT
jgi:hypothetical protein